MAEGNAGTQALEPNAASAPQISKRKPESPPHDGSDDPRRISKTPRLEQDQSSNLCHDLSTENGAKEEAIDKGKGKMIVLDEEKEPDKNLCHDSTTENGAKEEAIDSGKGKTIVQGEEIEPDRKLNHSTGVLVDKGKGKMIVKEEEAKKEQNPKPNSWSYVDKGKGKMIVEEEEEGSSDDSDEACAASGSDSEYSDDPLMEVDLNNILPSRTRRWAPPVPGAYLVPPDQDDDEDDDDDDASDDGVVDDDDDDEDDDVNDSESE